MSLNNHYLEVTVTAGAAAVTHIGIVDDQGAELAGGDPGYARQPVTWTEPSDDGVRHPTTDLDFDIPPETVIAGWQGYTAATEGTGYGIIPFADGPESFNSQGTATLLAAGTGLVHAAAPDPD